MRALGRARESSQCRTCSSQILTLRLYVKNEAYISSYRELKIFRNSPRLNLPLENLEHSNRYCSCRVEVASPDPPWIPSSSGFLNLIPLTIHLTSVPGEDQVLYHQDVSKAHQTPPNPPDRVNLQPEYSSCRDASTTSRALALVLITDTTASRVPRKCVVFFVSVVIDKPIQVGNFFVALSNSNIFASPSSSQHPLIH